ncbi:hypothetical protein [Prevotella intermedia]|uniref:hypothetical protein n=1 Tax=Prevotella intermedia TaxID=28131 RepID=UPI0012FD8C56|nr:hypothetical protein [Prevotella intermedia]
MTWEKAQEIGKALDVSPYEIMAAGKEESGALIILAILVLFLLFAAMTTEK